MMPARILLLSLLMSGIAPSCRPTNGPSASWLVVHWVGEQDERIPPLVLCLGDEDAPVVEKAIGEPISAVRAQPAEMLAIVRWLDQHPARQHPELKDGCLQLSLGNAKGATGSRTLTTAEAAEFFRAVAGDIPLSPRVRTAAANVAASYGIR
jgi:hypothetical protein